MITHIHLQNYRSFVEAEVALAPFTLVVGANGSGKTNFLKVFVDCGPWIKQALGSPEAVPPSHQTAGLKGHVNLAQPEPAIRMNIGTQGHVFTRAAITKPPPTPGSVEIFTLASGTISAAEVVVQSAYVAPDGKGTTQTLEALKNGDQEAMFDAAENALRSYVPEIEKLSFVTVENGKKQMQVRERCLRGAVPADQLSEGTRLIIALLAIVHQPTKPPVICLEDIDRGMHPRVFEQMVELMGRIAREQDVQIIATTHNPYLVDCFRDEPEAVVIVEKVDGASTLSTLALKLEKIDYSEIDPADMPLGNLWFSGFVGGVPEFLRSSRK